MSHVSAGLNIRSLEETHEVLWKMSSFLNTTVMSEDDIWSKSATRKTIAKCFVYHYFVYRKVYDFIMSSIA